MAAYEERIARLEESVFFQDRLLTELHEVLADQQRQIDTLTEAMRRMRLHLDALLAQGGDGPVNTPPPHWKP